MVFNSPLACPPCGNEVDVRMGIVGSFSTAHWLNPPYDAVLWEPAFGFSRGHRSVESGIPGIRISPDPCASPRSSFSSVTTV